MIESLARQGGINAAISGINAGLVIQNVAAANIANANTNNYEPVRVELSSLKSGGVEISEISSSSTAGNQVEGANVDIVNELFDLKIGTYMVAGSSVVMMAQSNSLGTIIDTLA